MKKSMVYTAGTTRALEYAAHYLKEAGVPVTQTPQWNVAHLLLDVPSFRFGTTLEDEKNLDTLLSALPQDITVWGGQINHPALADYARVDLLKDEWYLAQNAAITAHCALQVATPLLHTTIAETPTLILGWGRIGKCLGKLLRDMGCPVTIASGSEDKRALLESLGYWTTDTASVASVLSRFRLIFNTIPEMVLPEQAQKDCDSCIKIDLASRRGIAGEDVIWARGLPGVYAPESSGRLIAQSFLRLRKEEKP